MGWLDNIASLLNLKSEALRKLEQERDYLAGELRATNSALGDCAHQCRDQGIELLKLEQRVLNLKGMVDDAVSSPQAYYNWVTKQVGDITRYKTYWGLAREALKVMGIEWDALSIPESELFYTDEVSMNKIIPFLTYPAEYYTVSLQIDCDDYALWAAADASRIFNLNGIMQAKGYLGDVYHAFNLCVVGEGQYRLWEPNAGFPWAGSLFKIGENGYNVKKWR